MPETTTKEQLTISKLQKRMLFHRVFIAFLTFPTFMLIYHGSGDYGWLDIVLVLSYGLMVIILWRGKGRFVCFRGSWPFFFYSPVPQEHLNRQIYQQRVMENSVSPVETMDGEILRARQTYGESAFLYIWAAHGALNYLLRLCREPTEILGLSREEAIAAISELCPATPRMAELTLDHMVSEGILVFNQQERFERGRTGGELKIEKDDS